MGQNAKVASNKSKIVDAIPMACAHEAAAVEFMEKMRWGDDPCCPRCGSVDVYQMKNRKTGERNSRYLWRCRDCKRQYTVRVGTVMEDSPIPLRHWCYAFWRACTSKKGTSALEIQRHTGLTYKSALFLMQRIRFAMNGAGNTSNKLSGTVEVDETYVGGKPRHPGPKSKMTRSKRKSPVVALVARGGDVRAEHMTRVTAANLKGAIDEHVDRSARVVTDELILYRNAAKNQAGGHERIMHKNRQYVRGDIHTNTVEGFFAILKRGVYGIWHNVSPKHLHRYVGAAEFRYNTRYLEDGARVQRAISGAEGKRLMYRPVVG